MFLSHTASTQSDTASEFHDIFSGEGKLEQKLHREVDQSVQPVVTPSKETPLCFEGSTETGTRALSKDRHLTTL